MLSKKTVVFIFLCLLINGVSSLLAQTTITISPEIINGPLRNTMMGFTNRNNEENEWATLQQKYVQWNQIENNYNDGIDKIKAWCDANFVAKHNGNPSSAVSTINFKVIPRVILENANSKFWPADMTPGDYTSQQFESRVLRLIDRLGQVWDNDPRVAFVEMGLIGQWGEHWTTRPTAYMQNYLGNAFEAAFKNKKVLIRYPQDFTDFEFGIYWDSWAHNDHMNTEFLGVLNLTDRWREKVIGGEVAYDWGNYTIQPGADPTDTMKDPIHRNHLIYTIRRLHCTQLRWVADYNESDAAARTGAEEVQKAFGYRFIVNDFTFPSRINSGDNFTISFTVTNEGSAPFYHDWPIEVSLLDESRNVVWRGISVNHGAKSNYWQPGHGWNTPGHTAYDTPPVACDVFARFHYSGEENLTPGRYILALAVLDPAGYLPSLRFAIRNYFEGGRHPMAYVGINSTIGSHTIDPGIFDDPNQDLSLHYKYDPSATVPSAPSNVVAEDLFPGPIHVTWSDNSNNEDYFEIYHYQYGYDEFMFHAVVGPNVTSYWDPITGREGLGCYYQVRACNSAGCSDFSDQRGVIRGAPDNLVAAAPMQNQIDLSWTDNMIVEDAFEIERSPNGTDQWMQIASVPANETSYSNSDLPPSTTYYYRVRAAQQTIYSNYSNTDHATTSGTGESVPWTETFTFANGTTSDNGSTSWSVKNGKVVSNEIQSMNNSETVLTTGTINISGGSVNVSMSLFSTLAGKLETADYIKLFKKVDGGSEVLIGQKTDDQTATTITGSNITGSTLVLVVRAKVSDYSNEVWHFDNLSVTSAAVTIPAAPSNLAATAVLSSQINLSWTDNSTNETECKIERSPNGSSSWTQIATVGANVTTYSNTGLTASTKYYYRVRASNTAGNSAYSNTANATTQSGGGSNLLTNGDFSGGMTGWEWTATSPSTGSATVTSGQCYVDITNDDGTNWHLRLRQINLSMQSGTSYTASFDARAASNRSIILQVKNASGSCIYQTVNITTTMQPYTYTFTNNVGTASNFEFLLFFGAQGVKDVWVDNAVLKANLAKASEEMADAAEIILPTDTQLMQNYPNPFNPETTIPYQLSETAHVKLEIFNFQGRRVATLVNAQQSAGHYRVNWNATDANGNKVSSGMYVYRLQTHDRVQMKKFILLQ